LLYIYITSLIIKKINLVTTQKSILAEKYFLLNRENLGGLKKCTQIVWTSKERNFVITKKILCEKKQSNHI